MSPFRLNEQEIRAVESLKRAPAFSVLTKKLKERLDFLDKAARAETDGGRVLKTTGQALELSSILDAIGNV